MHADSTKSNSALITHHMTQHLIPNDRNCPKISQYAELGKSVSFDAIIQRGYRENGKQELVGSVRGRTRLDCFNSISDEIVQRHKRYPLDSLASTYRHQHMKVSGWSSIQLRGGHPF
jgi:hypothetical protein